MNKNTRNIVITIKARKQDDTTPDPKPDTTQDEGEEQEKNGFSYLTSVMANQAFQYAIGTVSQIASYEVNKYFTLRDDYETQEVVGNAYSALSWITQSGIAIFTTAKMGAAVGGPVGAAVGIAISTIGTGVSKAISVVQALDAQNLQIAQAGAQQAFSLSRYGNALTNGSVGESL